MKQTNIKVVCQTNDSWDNFKLRLLLACIGNIITTYEPMQNSVIIRHGNGNVFVYIKWIDGADNYGYGVLFDSEVVL